MADDNVFAADPSRVKSGGAVTNQVGEFARTLASTYEDATAYDPNNPPWGPNGDPTVDTIQQQYFVPHGDMRDALKLLGDAIFAAGDLTTGSGNSFTDAQEAALGAIKPGGGTDTGTTGTGTGARP